MDGEWLSEKRLGPWALLHNRAFILFQARGTANSIGYSVYVGTILWLSYRLTGGILWSGVLIGVQTIVFTLTFFISPLVDRLYDKRWVFVACYPMQAVLALVLGLTYAIGALTIPLLLVIVVFLAVLYDFTEAADETTTRLLFGRDHLFIVSGIAGAIGGGVSITLYFGAGATLALFRAIGGAFLLAGLLAVGTGLAVPLSIRLQGQRPKRGGTGSGRAGLSSEERKAGLSASWRFNNSSWASSSPGRPYF